MTVLEVCLCGASYALIRVKATYQPFVVAYGYDADSQTWCQGHYFRTYADAKKFFMEQEA